MIPRRTGSVVTLALLIAGAAADARALDMPLAGKKLGMRDGVRARLVLLTRDRISAPAPGLADDPTVAGGRLEIGNPETGEWGAFELPAAGWSFDNTGTRFRFHEPAPRGDTPGIQRLVVRHRRRLRLRTQGIGLTLDESRQGTIAVVLTMGGRRYCTVFGGIVTYDEPGRFGALDAPAPAACPETVTVSTTSTTTSSSTSATGAPTTTSSVAGGSTSTTTTSSVSSSTAESTTTTSTSTSSTTEEPTSTSSSLESSTSSSTTSTSSTSSSTAESTTTTSTSTSSTTEEPTSTSSSVESSTSSSFTSTTTTSSVSSSTAESTTSTSASSSSSLEDTTTSSTSSSTSSSETSTSTSSTTTSTDFTCGGVPPLACGGTCPPGQTCGGLFACTCN